MKKHSKLIAGLFIVFITGFVVVWFLFPAAEQKLCKEFLTLLYTSDGSRFQQLQKELGASGPGSSAASGVYPVPAEPYERYYEHFNTLLSSSAYESFAANGHMLDVDKFCTDNHTNLKVNSISFKQDIRFKGGIQYRYSIVIGSDYVATETQGVLVLKRVHLGKYLIDYFKPFERQPFKNLL